MTDNSGYCRKCEKHYEVSNEYDGRQHFAVCPSCSGNLTMNHSPLAAVKKAIHLAKSEIGEGIAGVRPQ